MPGLRWTETSLIARPAALRAADRDRRQLDRARSRRANARSKSVAEPVGVDRGEEPDLAEVDREHRDAGARVVAQRGEDRAVAAEHDAEVDVVDSSARRARRPSPGRERRACGVSSASKRSIDARAARARRDAARAARPRSRAARRWVSTVARARLTPRPLERRLDVGRAPRAPGLGEPHERLAVARRARQPATARSRAPSRRASRAASATAASASRRSVGVAHDAALADRARARPRTAA